MKNKPIKENLVFLLFVGIIIMSMLSCCSVPRVVVVDKFNFKTNHKCECYDDMYLFRTPQ